MIKHVDITDQEVRKLIRSNRVSVAGNTRLKIYGKLSCGSGKKMKKENRAFFSSEKEAIVQGFRPCGHCMKRAYEEWKDSTIRSPYPS